MYVPASFAISDEKTLESFIERYDFATLTSSSSTGLVASHIPILLRRSAEKTVLVGHLARANGQCEAGIRTPHGLLPPAPRAG